MFASVLAGAFAFAAVVIVVVVSGRFAIERAPADRRRAIARLRGLTNERATEPAEPAKPGSKVWAIVPRLGTLVVSAEGRLGERIRRKLALAGYTKSAALSYYVGTQLVLAAALAAGGLATAAAGGAGWRVAVVAAAVGGAAGGLAPPYVLSARVKRRQRLIRNALPDALDIMVMCLEGGVGLNAAQKWLNDEIRSAHPVLGAELATVQRESQLGVSVGEAFRSFADRCGVSDVRELSSVLLQAERYGASIARALRNHADAARQERQTWTEEVAQKAGVKIVFPTMFCIFPAMFIVLLGPASFQMAKMFTR